MWTEQRLHDELHSILDRREPPVDDRVLTTVLHRGRRRLRTQRAGLLGGVAIAVTAIGVGAATVPAPAPGGTGAQVATSDPRPRTPPRIPSRSASSTASATAGAPDWPTVPIAPPPVAGQPGVCAAKSPQQLPPAVGGVRPESEVVPAFLSAVTTIAAPAQVRRVRPTYWSTNDPKTGMPRGFVEVDVTDAGGTGSVQLEIDPMQGNPRQEADADAYIYANCTPPQRTILPSGDLLQLYPVMNGHTAQPRQTVRVYTPLGHVYTATAAGYGSVHMRPAEGGFGEYVEGGRGSVPLTAGQLARLAEELAALG